MEKAPVRIALLHACNTFNNGSFMMLINFIHYFRFYLPPNIPAELWMELEGQENRDRLGWAFDKETSGAGIVQFRYLPFRVTAPDRNSFTGKLLNLGNKFFAQVRYFRQQGISALIILGGDDISEYYKKWMIISDLLRIYRYTLHFKTILAGQTIGPFGGIRKEIASRCLAGAMIYSRDPITTQYLLGTLGHKSRLLVDSVDLAFADLPRQQGSFIPGPYELDPGSYISLVPGGFYTLYTPDKQQYLACWLRLVDKLIEEAALAGKKLVFLPHVTRPEDDRTIISSLRKMLNHPKHPLFFIEEELMPQQLRSILGNGHFTVSSRMHASVSTFQQGKPAISIGYSIKFDGVIGRTMGFPELLIQAQAELFRDPERFAETTMQRVRYLLGNYDTIRDRISGSIPSIKLKAMEQIRLITEFVLP